MSSTLDFDQQTSPSPSSNHLANGDQATTSTSLRFSSGSRSGTGSPGLHDRAAEDGANTLGRLGSVEGEGDVDGEGDAHDGVGDTPVTGTKRKRPVKKLRMKPLAEVLARLITGVKKRDNYQFFWHPVDTTQVPGYANVIKHPMDFGTMEEKIQRGEYKDVEGFKRDFVLTMSNAQTFNPPGSLYCNEAKRLESWGLRAIEREGLSAVLPDFESKAAADGSPAPRGKTIKLGSRLSASAHERSTSTGAYIPAAQAFGVSSPGAGMLGGVKQEDRDASLELGEGELDDGMEDDAVSDAESSVRGMSRERSMTRDGGKLGQRAIARLSNGTPSTPSQVSRQVSPETMRKRLASAKSASKLRGKFKPKADSGQAQLLSFLADGSVNPDDVDDPRTLIAKSPPPLAPALDSVLPLPLSAAEHKQEFLDGFQAAIVNTPIDPALSYSHNLSSLSPWERWLPFSVPSASGAKPGHAALPRAWPSLSTGQAENAEARGKGKEREREADAGDWTLPHPHLSRQLELTDLGLYSRILSARQDTTQRQPGAVDSKSSRAALPRYADVSGPALYSVLAQEIGYLPSRAYAPLLQVALGRPNAAPPHAMDLVNAIHTAHETQYEPPPQVRHERAVRAANTVRDAVYGDVYGEAYAQSVAAFVAGAARSVEVAGDVAKEESGVSQVDPGLRLDRPLVDWVQDEVVRPLTGGLHDVLACAGQVLTEQASSSNSKTQSDDVSASASGSKDGDPLVWARDAPELWSLLESDVPGLDQALPAEEERGLCFRVDAKLISKLATTFSAKRAQLLELERARRELLALDELIRSPADLMSQFEHEDEAAAERARDPLRWRDASLDSARVGRALAQYATLLLDARGDGQEERELRERLRLAYLALARSVPISDIAPLKTLPPNLVAPRPSHPPPAPTAPPVTPR